MGTNTLSTTNITSGSIIDPAHVTQFYTAFDADLVPRSSGEPSSGAGTIGTTTYPFSSGWFSTQVCVGASGAGKLGVGTKTPGSILDIAGVNAGATVESIFRNTTANASGVKTRLSFPVFNGTDGAFLESTGNSSDGYGVHLYTDQESAVLRLSASNIGNSSSHFHINQTGQITIGAETAIHKLGVQGDIGPTIDDAYDLGKSNYRFDDIYATNATIQTSDIRMKKDIKKCEYGIDFLKEIEAISYRWIEKEEEKRIEKRQKMQKIKKVIIGTDVEIRDGKHFIVSKEYETEVLVPVVIKHPLYTESGEFAVNEEGEKIYFSEPIFEEIEIVDRNATNPKRIHFGFPAQQVLEVLEKRGIPTSDFAPLTYDSESDRYGIRYGEFIPILVNALKEIDAENTVLKSRILDLEDRFINLEKKVNTK